MRVETFEGRDHEPRNVRSSTNEDESGGVQQWAVVSAVQSRPCPPVFECSRHGTASVDRLSVFASGSSSTSPVACGSVHPSTPSPRARGFFRGSLSFDSDVPEANAPRVRLQTDPAEISTIRYRPPTNGIGVRVGGRHLAVERNSVNVAGGRLRDSD